MAHTDLFETFTELERAISAHSCDIIDSKKDCTSSNGG